MNSSYLPLSHQQHTAAISSSDREKQALAQAQAQQKQPASALADVNARTLGTDFPEVTLPSGAKIQTGSAAAMLQNIRTYDGLKLKGGSAEDEKQLEEAIKAALPALQKVGMFDLFRPEEWMAGSSEGRKLVGRLAKDAGY